ncbi:MAG: helix-turn-helix domain-containing protein [Glaciimonas sp.]|nr:helix-turn-helix domain-containing protein [Glaciimonas sp.]
MRPFDQPVESCRRCATTHLTQEERYQIYALRTQGFTGSDIAKQLKRSKATISRELERVKTRLVVYAFHEQIRLFLLPFLECLNRRLML